MLDENISNASGSYSATMQSNTIVVNKSLHEKLFIQKYEWIEHAIIYHQLKFG